MAETKHYDLDSDTLLGGASASDLIIPSQKAIKSYVDNNSGSTVDQTYDGTSANPQSGVAIEGELSTNYVTTNTDQNITGVKTFVGDKRVKFKGVNSSSKLGFTAFDSSNREVGYLEAQGQGNASHKCRLGIYDTTNTNYDNVLGFEYYKGKGSDGVLHRYSLLCPPLYPSTTDSNYYIPMAITDGNTTVTADNTGSVNISSLLPTVPTNISAFTNDSGYITSSALSGYATETWVGQQGYALTSNLATVATSGSYNDLSNKPTIPSAQVNSDWDAVSGVAQILNKPSLGTMASESASDYTPTSGLATVATTGDYDDLINKPTIPSISNLADKDLSNLSVTGQNIADTVKDQNTVNTRLKFWSGTQAEYDDLVVNDEIDDDTYYSTPEDDISDALLSVLSAMFPIGALYIGTMNACPLQTLGVGTWTLVAQDKVLQGAGTRGNTGSTVNESLPNHTHPVSGDDLRLKSSTNGDNAVLGNSGSLGGWGIATTTNNVGNAKLYVAGSTSKTINAVYQDNAPVQQDAYLVNIWERTA